MSSHIWAMNKGEIWNPSPFDKDPQSAVEQSSCSPTVVVVEHDIWPFRTVFIFPIGDSYSQILLRSEATHRTYRILSQRKKTYSGGLVHKLVGGLSRCVFYFGSPKTALAVWSSGPWRLISKQRCAENWRNIGKEKNTSLHENMKVYGRTIHVRYVYVPWIGWLFWWM